MDDFTGQLSFAVPQILGIFDSTYRAKHAVNKPEANKTHDSECTSIRSKGTTWWRH